MSKGIGNRLSRCMKAPLRFLSSMRDLYVKGMTGCAGKVGQYHGSGINCPDYSEFAASGGFGSGRSNYSEEDLRELIRASSRARMNKRSQSVVVGRIDEDSPCNEFVGDVKVGSSLIFPRSSSVGVGVGVGSRGIKRREVTA